MGIFMERSSLESDGDDLGLEVTYSSLLGMKQKDPKQLHLSAESHSQKLTYLMPSFSKFIVKQLDNLELIALFNHLVSLSKFKPQIENLKSVASQVTLKMQDSQTLAKYTLKSLSENLGL